MWGPARRRASLGWGVVSLYGALQSMYGEVLPGVIGLSNLYCAEKDRTGGATPHIRKAPAVTVGRWRVVTLYDWTGPASVARFCFFGNTGDARCALGGMDEPGKLAIGRSGSTAGAGRWAILRIRVMYDALALEINGAS